MITLSGKLLVARTLSRPAVSPLILSVRWKSSRMSRRVVASRVQLGCVSRTEHAFHKRMSIVSFFECLCRFPRPIGVFFSGNKNNKIDHGYSCLVLEGSLHICEKQANAESAYSCRNAFFFFVVPGR